jgi:hypothetical protein
MAGGATRMGGSVWHAQGRAATLSRRSRMTACWRWRFHRGTALRVGPEVRQVRGACTARRRGDTHGADFEACRGAGAYGRGGLDCWGLGLRVARTPRSQRTGAASRRSARPARFYLLRPTLATNYSKKLNRSWPNFEYENCRSRNPLSLSKKGSMGFFSTNFAGKGCQLWMPLGFHEHEILTFGQVFHAFPLKTWSANLHESCVPQQAGQLP